MPTLKETEFKKILINCTLCANKKQDLVFMIDPNRLPRKQISNNITVVKLHHVLENAEEHWMELEYDTYTGTFLEGRSDISKTANELTGLSKFKSSCKMNTLFGAIDLHSKVFSIGCTISLIL